MAIKLYYWTDSLHTHIILLQDKTTQADHGNANPNDNGSVCRNAL